MTIYVEGEVGTSEGEVGERERGREGEREREQVEKVAEPRLFVF